MSIQTARVKLFRKVRLPLNNFHRIVNLDFRKIPFTFVEFTQQNVRKGLDCVYTNR